MAAPPWRMFIVARPSRPTCRDGKKLRHARGAQQAAPCAGLLRRNTTSGFAALRYGGAASAAIPDGSDIIVQARTGRTRPAPVNFAGRSPRSLSGSLIFGVMFVRSDQSRPNGMEERRRFPRTEINE